MVHACVRILPFVLALAVVACADEQAPAALDASVDVDATTSAADIFDPASCDPLGFEQMLEVSSANIMKPLEQRCFNSGLGRRALVIEALCARDRACGVSHANACRAEYEARWQERERPNGLSVPCADALLDAMSCNAQARCDDPHGCDAARKRADAKCDPNAPLLGAPACPPLPDDRELTKGPIPDDAINDAGMLDETRIPDFIPALDQSGEIAGYVRHCALAAGGAIPVYAEDLETVVGHMLPGQGFVPGALR